MTDLGNVRSGSLLPADAISREVALVPGSSGTLQISDTWRDIPGATYTIQTTGNFMVGGTFDLALSDLSNAFYKYPVQLSGRVAYGATPTVVCDTDVLGAPASDSRFTPMATAVVALTAGTVLRLQAFAFVNNQSANVICYQASSYLMVLAV